MLLSSVDISTVHLIEYSCITGWGKYPSFMLRAFGSAKACFEDRCAAPRSGVFRSAERHRHRRLGGLLFYRYRFQQTNKTKIDLTESTRLSTESRLGYSKTKILR